jgi:hypothetical protein
MGVEQHKVQLLTLAVITGLSLIATACAPAAAPVPAAAPPFVLPQDGLAPVSDVVQPSLSAVPVESVIVPEQMSSPGTIRYFQFAVREQIEAQTTSSRADGIASPLGSFAAKYFDVTTPMPAHPENFAVVRIGSGWQVVELENRQAAFKFVDELNQFPKTELLYHPKSLTDILAPVRSAPVIIEPISFSSAGITTRSAAEQLAVMYENRFAQQGALDVFNQKAEITGWVGGRSRCSRCATR